MPLPPGARLASTGGGLPPGAKVSGGGLPPGARAVEYPDEDVPHPGISRLQRSQLVELAPEDAVATLRGMKFEAEHLGGGHIRLKKPEEKSWKRLDPTYFEPLEDVGDISPFVAESMVAAPLTAKATVAGAAAGGPYGWITGPIAGGLAFGAQMAGMEALKQGALKAAGNEVTLKGAGSRVLEEGAYGAAGEVGGQLLAKGVGAAFRAAKGAGKGLRQAASEVPYSRTEMDEAVALVLREGGDPKPMLESLAVSRGGMRPDAASKLSLDELKDVVLTSQKGMGLRGRVVSEKAGEFIDKRVGEELDIVAARRNPKEDPFTGKPMLTAEGAVAHPAGELRRYPRARYGPHDAPFEGVRTLPEIAQALKPYPDEYLREGIRRNLGTPRPILNSLDKMSRTRLLDWIYKNQKGFVKGPPGTSRGPDLAQDLRTVLELDTPPFEIGNSWRRINLPGVESIRSASGDVMSVARPGLGGRVMRRMIGARGPLKEDVLARVGGVMGKGAAVLKFPGEVASKVFGVRRPGMKAALAFGSMSPALGGTPLGKAIGGSYLAGRGVEVLANIAKRDSGNLIDWILSRGDIPGAIFKQVQKAQKALETRGLPAYRAAMLALVHSEAFQSWVEGQESDTQGSAP